MIVLENTDPKTAVPHKIAKCLISYFESVDWKNFYSFGILAQDFQTDLISTQFWAEVVEIVSSKNMGQALFASIERCVFKGGYPIPDKFYTVLTDWTFNL